MINRETAKQFLEVNGYPNPDSNFENELLDTMVEYAQQQVKNNDLLHSVVRSYLTQESEFKKLPVNELFISYDKDYDEIELYYEDSVGSLQYDKAIK